MIFPLIFSLHSMQLLLMLYTLYVPLICIFKSILCIFQDVILHIRDISNLDWRAQDEEVMKTLERLGLDDEGRKDRVITIDNKVLYNEITMYEY